MKKGLFSEIPRLEKDGITLSRLLPEHAESLRELIGNPRRPDNQSAGNEKTRRLPFPGDGAKYSHIAFLTGLPVRSLLKSLFKGPAFDPEKVRKRHRFPALKGQKP